MRTRFPTISLYSVHGVLVLAGACTDGPVAPGLRPEPRLLTSEYECTVDVAAETTQCRVSAPATGAQGPRLHMLAGTSALTFVSSWVHSRGSTVDEDTSTNTLSFTNNMGQPIGTTDGVSVHADGNRLFFTVGPEVITVYSGTLASASIQLVTPDGTASFSNPESTMTYTNRPYYVYSGIVAPGTTSTSRAIRYIYSSNVKSFRYRYFVSTPVQHEYGWVAVSPTAVPVLSLGETATLTGTVYNAFGVVQADGITWSSSNVAVATVDAAGLVTAVGEGTVTITATSTVNAQRTGTRTVTVDAVPAVASTAPADSAMEVWPADNVVISFSEPVDVSTSSFSLDCNGSQSFAVSGSGSSEITLNPVNALPPFATCTVTVVAAQVSDADANDGPDNPAADYVFSFRTENVIIFDP